MSSFSRNVPILAFCQAMALSSTSLVITTAALVGYELAEDKSLSTLPLAVMFIAVMLSSIPAVMLMNKIGRKTAFLFSSFFGLSGSAIASWAILEHDFSFYILGVSLLGIFNAFANNYRFTAADSVDEDHKSRAISLVLAGGVVAAFIGPNLAIYTKDIFYGVAFAGSYAALLVVYFLSMMSLMFLKLPNAQDNKENTKQQRNLRVIIKQPVWVVAVICGMLGYGIMSFIMTATPLAMKHHQHLFTDTSFVIQWHVLAMFAPSFITGSLIKKWGELRIMFVGVMLGFVCVFINISGFSVDHFWVALMMLGLSWNFLFVGATSLLTHSYKPE